MPGACTRSKIRRFYDGPINVRDNSSRSVTDRSPGGQECLYLPTAHIFTTLWAASVECMTLINGKYSMHHQQFPKELKFTLDKVIISTGMTRAALTYFNKSLPVLFIVYIFIYAYLSCRSCN